jgi:hypothetical protein
MAYLIRFMPGVMYCNAADNLLFPTDRKVDRTGWRSVRTVSSLHARLDPIINSQVAKTSQHVHTVMGAFRAGERRHGFRSSQQTCNVAQDT